MTARGLPGSPGIGFGIRFGIGIGFGIGFGIALPCCVGPLTCSLRFVYSEWDLHRCCGRSARQAVLLIMMAGTRVIAGARQQAVSY